MSHKTKAYRRVHLRKHQRELDEQRAAETASRKHAERASRRGQSRADEALRGCQDR